MRNHSFTQHLADYLVQDELLSQESLPELLAASQQKNIAFITYLVRENIVASENILACCSRQFLLPVWNISENTFRENLLPPEIIIRYRILPLFRDQHSMQIAISDPTNHIAISAIHFHTGLSISPILICEKTLDEILINFSRNKSLSTQLESALSKIIPIEEMNIQDSESDNDEPISEFVKKMLDNAVLQHISDIHIEPFRDHCRIRFRRDGLLHEVANTPSHFALRLITRLKIMSHLNIAERRLPQDGRLSSNHELIDIRINTCPTLFGEKIVLRLLNAHTIQLEIEQLGFTDDQKKLFIKKLSQPQGLILVTGPTGSGKTITLYSALHYLNKMEKNISSVEDPVELEFIGINQVNVNPRIGLDFAQVLRSMLRQDPDIIMIGEIRDKETAAIAIQAAQTGHLVLSTLHTNNAIESISRLQSMGVAAHHFISSVSLIIAQRLVRKACTRCNHKIDCNHCHQGYRGRTGIFECLPITEKISSHILSGTEKNKLQEIFRQESWMTLQQAGMALVNKGITHEAEILRVLGND